jgi:hypothetical protein
MKLYPGRLLAGSLLVLAVAAPGAGATPVSVRIAGDTAKLGPVAVDTVATGQFGPDACPNNSAGGAIDLAVKQNWDRTSFVQTILGETHAFANNDSWAFWINGSLAQVGICAYVPQAGDRLLMIADVSSPTFAPTVFPLSFASVPTRVTAGEPFTVVVREHRSDGMTTTPAPVAGATVTAGSVTAMTSADGSARLELPKAGKVTLTATKPGLVSTDPATVTVTAAGAAADEQGPVVRIAGLRDGQRFRRAAAPRAFRGRVQESGRVRSVQLRLSARAGGRCLVYSAAREQFVPARCGAAGRFFTVARRARWSYRLPGRLGPGRYVVSVRATDAAGNRGTVERVRFRVA